MNYKKWHLHAVDGFVSFLKQKLENKQRQLDSVEFALHEIPSIPNNLIFSKLTGKYAACARLTCKSWKAQIDQLTDCLHPNYLNSLQILAYFSNIQTLDLQFCRNVTDVELQNVSSLPYLRNLNLKRCKEVTDQGMIYLGDCKQLVVLNIARCNNVGNEGVRSISKNNQNLKYLNIKCLFKLDSGIEDVLENLTELTYLNFSGLEKVNDNNLTNLSKLSKLQTLQLEKCPNLTEEIFWHVSQLPELSKFEHSFPFSIELTRILKGKKSLGFFNSELLRSNIREFYNNSETCSNSFSDVTDLKMTFIAARNLNHIFYIWNLKPNYNVQILLRNLKHLKLFGDFVQFQINRNQVPKNLTDLTLEQCESIDSLNLILQQTSTFKNIKIIQKFPRFQQSQTFDITFFKEVFKNVSLESLANIQSISVVKENFVKMDMVILAKLPNLVRLFFENCNFKEDLENIKDLRSVCKLSFKKCVIAGNFVDALVGAFAVLKNLYYLNIEGVKNKQLASDKKILLAKAPQGLQLLLEPY